MYDQQVLLEYYETKFGIHDHLSSTDPLALVTFHPSESFRVNNLYDNYFRTFIYRDIGKKLGISFDEYLAKPRFEIERINKIAEEIDKQKADAQRDALENINKGKKGDELDMGIPPEDI